LTLADALANEGCVRQQTMKRFRGTGQIERRSESQMAVFSQHSFVSAGLGGQSLVAHFCQEAMATYLSSSGAPNCDGKAIFMSAFELTRASSGIIKATLHGMWSLEDLAKFTSSLDAMMAKHASHRGEQRFRMLVDGRDYGVQAGMIVEGMQKYLSTRTSALARTAVIVARALHKLQTKRVDPSPTQAVFFDEAEAREWLLLGAID
jgi:hypothetical protein